MILDFIEYWASARLLWMGENPYSLEQLLAVEQSVGWSAPFPHIMWNPPWTLAFLIPFGWAEFETALIIWMAMLAAVALFCSNLLWRLYGGDESHYRRAWVIGLTFAPTVFALLLQQIGLFTLLGIVGFLHFEKRKSHKAAGASLILVAIKPHLYYLFWIVLLLWMVERRRWDVLVGFGAAMLVASAIPMALDAQVFNQYVQLYLTAPYPTPFDQETPTLARALRHLININNPLPQFLPAAFGLLWLAWYWKTYKSSWNWAQQIAPVLLASVTTNFFAWTCDQVMVIPALLQASVWLSRSHVRAHVVIPVMMYLVTELAVPLVKLIGPYDFYYFWLSLVWCLIYAYVRKTSSATAYGPALV